MQKAINERFQISPFLVFFLIHSVQVGVGILGFQSSLVKIAGNDSWMVVFIAGFTVHILIFCTFLLLNKSKKDLIQLNNFVFGKFIGGLFSIIWIFYYMFVGITVLFTYFEVIQVWMFPKISIFWLTILFLILVSYTVLGGFRIVAGLSFFGVVIPFYLFFSFLFPLEFSDFRALLPIWNHSIKEIGSATIEMTLSYIGFSTLLMYYPYIKQPEKSQKWAHLGAALTTIIYQTLLCISIMFFSEKQLIKQVWATLTLWKIVEMPFVERFEYIGITSWALIILPNICLSFWASSRGIKVLFNINQRIAFFMILLLVTGLSFFFNGRERIELLIKYVSKVGLVTEFIFIPVLLALYFLISKIKGRKTS
jgi:spore germination protein (amino acid permease)